MQGAVHTSFEKRPLDVKRDLQKRTMRSRLAIEMRESRNDTPNTIRCTKVEMKVERQNYIYIYLYKYNTIRCTQVEMKVGRPKMSF